MATLVLALHGCGAASDDPVPNAASSPGEALLSRAIGYHDPNGAWAGYEGTLSFEEMRPGGEIRETQVSLSVPTGMMTYRSENQGLSLVKEVTADGCQASVDGRPPTEAEVEALGLSCERIERSRNYYLYLWGLPMKLRDPGTHVGPHVERARFQEADVDQVRVTYDPEVGGDTWYFYFEPESARLVGYRFYHDESANDGEYITLEGEAEVAGMRLPANRRWYVNADDRFLGEDRLVGSH